jgi:hypothetical protein
MEKNYRQKKGVKNKLKIFFHRKYKKPVQMYSLQIQNFNIQITTNNWSISHLKSAKLI